MKIVRNTAAALIVAMPVALVAPAAWAELDCGDFGLEDAQQAAEFCAELDAILKEPFAGGTGDRSDGEPREELRRIIESDALLHEAWRSQPQKTLDLIQRIRDAGGLAQ